MTTFALLAPDTPDSHLPAHVLPDYNQDKSLVGHNAYQAWTRIPVKEPTASHPILVQTEQDILSDHAHSDSIEVRYTPTPGAFAPDVAFAPVADNDDEQGIADAVASRHTRSPD